MHNTGAYAVVIKSRHYPAEMVATRRGSPLLVGVKCESRLITDHIPVIFTDASLRPSSPSAMSTSSSGTPMNGGGGGNDRGGPSFQFSTSPNSSGSGGAVHGSSPKSFFSPTAYRQPKGVHVTPGGPNVLVSPATLGGSDFHAKGENNSVEYFFASDASAIIEHTNQVSDAILLNILIKSNVLLVGMWKQLTASNMEDGIATSI